MLIGGSERPEAAAGSREAALGPRLVFHRLPGRSREEVLAEFARRLAMQGSVKDAGELTERLLKRERDGCTGVGRGIAIPHCRLENLDGEVVAFASTEHPVPFGAADGEPVDLIFLVVSPAQAAAAHLQAVARVSRLLRVPGIGEALRRASTARELLITLRDAEGGLAVTA
jgi:mannitol/fructose-specific phosphotransferase system IIA component (Ntr-type)